jgi:hypothetical protein
MAFMQIFSFFLVKLTGGDTFEKGLPMLKENGIYALNWGLVYGKTNTIYPWGKRSIPKAK